MYLIFTMQGDRYALELAQVAAVANPARCWPIPSVPDCYTGAINMQGNIIAVIDLALFLGLPGSREPGKMIILSPEIASLAFLVEGVLRVVPEDEVALHDPPPIRFAAASLVLAGERAILLDVVAIVQTAEAMMAR